MVHLSDDDARRLGVAFGHAEVRSLDKTIRTVGFVTAAEPRMHWIAPKIGGWIEKLYVDFTGDWVREGQPLIEIYSPELVTAQEELILARNLQRSLASSSIPEVRGAADTLLNSARQRLDYWDISEEQIREVEETGRVRRTLTLKSPWSGIVMEKNVLSGSAIKPGQPLYMIADLSEVWIETEFYEADLALISEGQLVEVSVTAYPGESFAGRLEYVYPTLEQKTRTLKARIAVRNTRNRLKPGLYATVKLTANVADSALAIPGSAIVQTGEREMVFVVRPDGMLEPRQVRLGLRTSEWAEVLAGLEAGERVVSSATFLIDSESNLGAALTAMAGHAGHGSSAPAEASERGSK
ncbi:MAG: efflux RND transporter periplasmic adaptor subunit [Gemmatimonadales bacterium]|nr:efflux RND transporter periplasmic adaptor subunit [Gemmatimonadales bacterium]NIN12093.1 efflux RND transporter periplasmic adaptor subunit [Gemmatimonadales bacterium]NIR03328.1 efflux RND transporter periplasmic adaptor subunit [Gemmatimonadales bacterium]NIS67008.1 efflux RND transporter periplasmic adaptor subunit [Gemmatimonadales bacterium]